VFVLVQNLSSGHLSGHMSAEALSSSGHLSGLMSAEALSWLVSYISCWQSVGVFSSAKLLGGYGYLLRQMSAEVPATGRPNRSRF
jgi:hypothetical protein